MPSHQTLRLQEGQNLALSLAPVCGSNGSAWLIGSNHGGAGRRNVSVLMDSLESHHSLLQSKMAAPAGGHQQSPLITPRRKRAWLKERVFFGAHSERRPSGGLVCRMGSHSRKTLLGARFMMVFPNPKACTGSNQRHLQLRPWQEAARITNQGPRRDHMSQGS